MHPGWEAQISRWLEQTTSTTILKATQVNQYYLTSTIKYLTNGGTYFVKASESLIESKLTGAIFNELPSVATEYLAALNRDECFISKSEGFELATCTEFRFYQRAIEKIGILHASNSKMKKVLGSSDLSVESAQDSLTYFTNLLASDYLMSRWGITQEGKSKLILKRDEYRRLFLKVAGINYCHVLNHGDPHHKNAVVENDMVRWFDWAEALFAHPGYDLGWFLAYFENDKVGSLPKDQRVDDKLNSLVRTYSAYSGFDFAGLDLKALKVFSLISRISVYGKKYEHVLSAEGAFVPGYVKFFVSLLLKIC